MTGAIASSGLTNLGLDEAMSGYAGSLPEDPINLESISQYLNCVDDGARSERLSVTPQEFCLDPDLQSLSSSAISSFEIGEFVRVTVPALDRVSTDAKRIFGQVKRVHISPSYEIQTK